MVYVWQNKAVADIRVLPLQLMHAFCGKVIKVAVAAIVADKPAAFACILFNQRRQPFFNVGCLNKISVTAKCNYHIII